jgi:hypothetical protein
MITEEQKEAARERSRQRRLAEKKQEEKEPPTPQQIARRHMRGPKPKARGYPFTIICVDVDGTQRRYTVEGWRSCVEKVKALRMAHPFARALYAVATF